MKSGIILSIIFLFHGCIGAGNIGKLTFVQSNLSEKCIDLYGSGTIALYEVPDTLKEFAWHYDHLDVTNLYFSNHPRSIYRVVMYPSCRILSVYDFETKKELSREASVTTEQIDYIVLIF